MQNSKYGKLSQLNSENRMIIAQVVLIKIIKFSKKIKETKKISD